jgi:DNA repair exonuclease SbcCD ATPase subunit
MSEKGLKIIELKAENVKKLKAIEIRPDDNTVVISGRNEQGKTSVLDSIWFALGGKDAMKGLKKPIREGEEKAQITIDLGDIIVTRKWTGNDKSYLTVENRDGAIFKSPQAILDNLIGNLSFDPLAFSHMSDKEQKEALLDLVNIDLDLEEWENDRKEAYEDRTDVNRKVKELEGQLAGIQFSEDTPDEEVSASTVLEEIAKAQEVKDANDEKRRSLQSGKDELGSLDARMEEVDNFILSMNEELAAIHAKLATAEENKGKLKAMVAEQRKTCQGLNMEVMKLEDPDMSAFHEKLNNVEEVNKAIREKKKGVEIQASLDTAKAESKALTEEIEEMDEAKSSAITSAKFPIEHLGFDDTGVTYKGIPFGQCSAAESLRVSLSIAMAANPKLKVLRITDGSLLDSKNMKIIQNMVKENDYQCWVEIVDESGKMGIYIEDGEIKEVS